jgi:CRP-like cAMP-binding protein
MRGQFSGKVRESPMSTTIILKQADIFAELTATQIELIASICTSQMYRRNDIIFEENSASDELYLIVNGEIDIQIDPALIGGDPADGPQTIATLGRGQSFGEVALVDQGVRSASARCAQQDTELIVIPRDKLMLLCDTYPQLGYRLMRNLAADLSMKIRNTDLLMREQIIWMKQQSG